MKEKNIYQNIKQHIVLLEYEPGKVIREKEIMKEFGVSRTPVREALMRLEMEGLVRIIPKVGTIVEEVSFQQLKDVFETLSHLIQLTGKLAATRITTEEIAEIRQRVSTMRVTKDTKTLIELDGEIHQIINKSTRNDVLVKMLESLYERTIRIWFFSGAESGYWENLVHEFVDITDALEQRDEERTSYLLDKHMKSFIEHIRGQLSF